MLLANQNMIQNEDEILDGFFRHKSAMFYCGYKNAMFSAVILEYECMKCEENFFWRNVRSFWFFGIEARKFHSPKYKNKFLEKIWELFKLGARKKYFEITFSFPKYKKFFKSIFLYFELGKLLSQI